MKFVNKRGIAIGSLAFVLVLLTLIVAGQSVQIARQGDRISFYDGLIQAQTSQIRILQNQVELQSQVINVLQKQLVAVSPQVGVSDNFPFHDTVNVVVTHLGVVTYNETYPNLKTNAGNDVIARQTACGATSAPACANGGIYIALTTNTATPLATDTTCTGEETLAGLARALGTYSHTTGTNTHRIQKVFTYTGSVNVVVAKVCMFDASSAGNMPFETLLTTTATVSANGDTLTINWDMNY